MNIRHVILVVDDDDRILGSTIRFLNYRGQTVLSARNGREGLEMFRQNPCISRVLADNQMPEMGGLEMILAMRAIEHAEGRKPAIICLNSGNLDEDIITQAIAAGANSAIAKNSPVGTFFATLKLGEPE